MIDLFTASIVAERLEHHGTTYKDVTVNWLVDRQHKSLHVPSYIFLPHHDEKDRYYMQSFIDECFTARELALFLAWHQKHYGYSVAVNKVELPLPHTIAGFEIFADNGYATIIDFSRSAGRDLPFRLSACYDVHGCELAKDPWL